MLTGREKECVTITRQVRLTSVIVDTQFIACTEAAAELYGYASSQGLIGRYLSQVTETNDLRLGYMWSLARKHRRANAAHMYAVRIVHPEWPKPRWVEKQVRQCIGRDAIYWTSELRLLPPCEQPPSTPKLPTLADLDLTERDYVAHNGLANVAKIEEMMRHDTTAEDLVDLLPVKSFPLTPEPEANVPSQKNQLTIDKDSTKFGLVKTKSELFSHDEIMTTKMADTPVEFGPLHTIRIELSGGKFVFLHECKFQSCFHQFTSTSGKREKCPQCGRRNWHIGKTKWDERRDQRDALGEPVTHD